MSDVAEKGPVFLTNRVPIDAVQVRVVEKVPLNAPYLVVHLLPFGSGIDLHLRHPRPGGGAFHV